MIKLNFEAVFKKNEDNTISPKQKVRISNIEISPNALIKKGIAVGGIDIAAFEGHDLQVETDGDILVIKGIF